jgi:hypothetical protein
MEHTRTIFSHRQKGGVKMDQTLKTEQGMAYSIPQFMARMAQGLAVPSADTFYTKREVPVEFNKMDMVEIQDLERTLRAKSIDAKKDAQVLKNEHERKISEEADDKLLRTALEAMANGMAKP